MGRYSYWVAYVVGEGLNASFRGARVTVSRRIESDEAISEVYEKLRELEGQTGNRGGDPITLLTFTDMTPAEGLM